MDQIEHPSELEREIERAKRLASGIGDQLPISGSKRLLKS
jgi:hypothetical protein